jgi:hypothetical protein
LGYHLLEFIGKRHLKKAAYASEGFVPGFTHHIFKPDSMHWGAMLRESLEDGPVGTGPLKARHFDKGALPPVLPAWRKVILPPVTVFWVEARDLKWLRHLVGVKSAELPAINQAIDGRSGVPAQV